MCFYQICVSQFFIIVFKFHFTIELHEKDIGIRVIHFSIVTLDFGDKTRLAGSP